MRGLDLGLETADFTLGIAETKDLVVRLPVPMKVRALVKLTSGDLDIDIDKNTTGVYGASEATKAVTGTAEEHLPIESDATNIYVVVRLTGGAGGAVISTLYLEVSGMLPEGQDWHTVRYGHNALALQVNSGLYTADSND
jgi:hypothetical protein